MKTLNQILKENGYIGKQLNLEEMFKKVIREWLTQKREEQLENPCSTTKSGEIVMIDELLEELKQCPKTVKNLK
jgi:hypothetical protein